MRTLFLFIIIVLCYAATASLSFAEAMEASCHEDKSVPVELATPSCCCDLAVVGHKIAIHNQALTDVGCCLPQTCAVPLALDEAASSSQFTFDQTKGLDRTLLVYQPVLLVSAVKAKIRNSPLRPPPAPLFTQHCSFLI